PVGSLARLLHDLGEAPALRLTERTRLDDANGVADAGRVGLVVGVELRRPADDLLVLRVALDHVDLDDDRLVALVGDDDAAALLAPAELGVRLRDPRDRLALRRLLARKLRARAPCRARDVLERLLLLGRSGGRGFLLRGRGLLNLVRLRRTRFRRFRLDLGRGFFGHRRLRLALGSLFFG